MAETKFAETEVLLAALNGDADRLKELLRGMTPGELGNLETAARWVKYAAAEERQSRAVEKPDA